MDEIVGAWSADALFAPGTSDEIIYFLESGEGWIEYLNWSLSEIETFKWWRNEAGRINIKGETIHSNSEPLKKSNKVHSNLIISIQQGTTTTDKPITILSVENDNLFETNKYGLVKRIIEKNYFAKRLILLNKS
ncbi:hypothetical protein [Bacillus sp. FJAT-28004]|uniref:hypothetical protein n=1 Tax=Bacillus sp. FJAT-28004 TaxID=1679165 RepID=UPI0006B4E019|nr:hypothetical protein [Bacillus sp. FJAT-28004]